MYVVALTGGIGSGKSTVANLFAQKEVLIIDTDLIAHQLTAKNSEVVDQLAKMFGKNILLEDGSLNRPELRAIVFNSSSEKTKLETYLHPLIRKEAGRQIELASANQQQLANSNLPQKNLLNFANQPNRIYFYAILVIPLLVESIKQNKFKSNLDTWKNIYQRVLTVTVDREIRKQRLLSSRDLDNDTINKILASQAIEPERLAIADDQIDNSRDLQFLQQQVNRLHQQYQCLALG